MKTSVRAVWSTHEVNPCCLEWRRWWTRRCSRRSMVESRRSKTRASWSSRARRRRARRVARAELPLVLVIGSTRFGRVRACVLNIKIAYCICKLNGLRRAPVRVVTECTLPYIYNLSLCFFLSPVKCVALTIRQRHFCAAVLKNALLASRMFDSRRIFSISVEP